MKSVAKQIDLSSWPEIPFRVLLFFTVLVLCVKHIMDLFRKNARHMKFAKTLPGPSALPLVGNSLEFSDETVGLPKMLVKYEEKYGSIYRLWFGKNLVIGTSDLDLIDAIFQSSKTLDKPHFFFKAGLQFWGAENVFIAPTHLWKKTRKGMQPFFTKNSLSASIPRINRLVRKYVNKVEEKADGSEFNGGHILDLLSFEIIMEVVLNASLDCPEDDFRTLLNSFNSSESVLSDKVLKPWLCNGIADLLYYRNALSDFKNELNHFYEKVKSKQILSQEEKSSDSESPLIHLLHEIKSDVGLSEDYVKVESVHMIKAASITTAHVASFGLLMVAMHPDIQDKLYAEIVDTLGTEDRDLDVDELNNLPYLDQVLKESERRFLHDPIMFRHAYEDIKYGPHTIPAGSAIMIASSAIHMSPKYYKEPNKFDPEHFSAEAVSKRPKLAFFPFSVGARNCPGKVLAETELKLFMVKFIQRFKFSSTETMENLDVIAGFRIYLDKYKMSAQRRDKN